MKPRVMFRAGAHLSPEIVLSLGEKCIQCWWENMNRDIQYSCPSFPRRHVFFQGGCTVMRHLAEAKTLQKQGCSRSRCWVVFFFFFLSFRSPVVSTRRCRFPYLWNSLDFRAVVLLGSAMVSMLTWFGSLDAAPAGPLLKDTALARSLSLSLCLPARWKKKKKRRKKKLTLIRNFSMKTSQIDYLRVLWVHSSLSGCFLPQC